MARQGVGAEAHARFKQCEFMANHDIVDFGLCGIHEPTGELESVSEKIVPRPFGEHGYKGTPREADANLKKRVLNELDLSESEGCMLREERLFSVMEGDFYQPKTKETRAAYEAIVSLIQQQFGRRPLNMVCWAVDEILAVLKNDVLKNPYKKKEIEKLLNPIPNQVFDLLVLIGKLITDFQDGGDRAGVSAAYGDKGLDDDVGMAVEFEENEDEEEESDLVMVEEDEKYDNASLENGSGDLEMGDGTGDDDMHEVNDGLHLNVQHPSYHSDQVEREKFEEGIISFDRHRAIIHDLMHATKESKEEFQENLEKIIEREACRQNGQCQLLDLDNLAFEQGGLLMANKNCDLPVGSFRHYGKGYVEVHVPALKSKPLEPNERLVKISEMPEWVQPAFKGMQQLNRVQSKVYETALFSAENILLCAPTGAGKTDVAVLTILQQLALNMDSDGCINHNNYKIVYLAPMEVLVTEVVGNLSKRLEAFGVSVRGLSGDQSLDEAQIIVTTPEKWDSFTRKSRVRTCTRMVKLLIIDEVHLLHDNRGPVLESIVARIGYEIETTKEHIRFVGFSASLANFEDVALFLRVKIGRGLFHFDNSYRSVPLSQQYVGITVKNPLQRFQLMNDICYQKVMAVAGKHQVLVFVHSRKETAATARAILDTALANDTLGIFLKEDAASREILRSRAVMVESSDLKDLLPCGFAIHHAGLARTDCQIVEQLFADGHVQVLVSTKTLAWGVNLPAHSVIIKGTQVYSPEKGAWTELSPLDVMQMMGHAGRPQSDSYGEGIIITGHSELEYYLSLMNQQLPIESQFVSKLALQLNAEIVLGTFQNAREACDWLAYTYLFVRMMHNPTLYGLPASVIYIDLSLVERRTNLIHSAATILDKTNLVKYDGKSGHFQATVLGRVLATTK